MLVLSRKIGESIVIVVPPSKEKTTIKVTITDRDRVKIKLGTEAPRWVQVDREEIWKLSQPESK